MKDPTAVVEGCGCGRQEGKRRGEQEDGLRHHSGTAELSSISTKPIKWVRFCQSPRKFIVLWVGCRVRKGGDDVVVVVVVVMVIVVVGAGGRKDGLAVAVGLVVGLVIAVASSLASS